MKVQELIDKLEEIEDKDMDIYFDYLPYYEYPVEEVIETSYLSLNYVILT